jgi:hypothetical protein
MSSDLSTDSDAAVDERAVVSVPPGARAVGADDERVAGDRWAARLMRSIAALGVVTSLVVAVVTWQFLSDLDRNLDRSLAIGEDAASTLTETIDVAGEVVDALDDGLGTIGSTLDEVARTTQDTQEVAGATADLAASLPSTFEDVDAALATVESLSGTIDGALRAASRIPLGPDYDPEVPFPVAVGDLREAFGPLGSDLTRIAEELESFSDGSGAVGTELEAVRADVDRTRLALVDSDRLLDQYRDAAEQAGDLARTSRDDFDRSLRLARWAAVLVALLIAASQYVPWWLSRRLGAPADDAAVWTSSPRGTDAAVVPKTSTS